MFRELMDDMKRAFPRKKKTFTIRLAVFFIPVIFILFFLLPAAYFLTQNALKEAEERAYERLSFEVLQINTSLQQSFTIVQHINDMNAGLITTGQLDYRSVGQLQSHFLAQLRALTFVSSIYFGNTEGGLADAGREAGNRSYYLISTDDFAAGAFNKYASDADGNPTERISRTPGFDARTRDWYRKALAADSAVWSDIYVLFTGQDMTVSASRPVYAEDGRLLGVIANDLFVGQLSAFLRTKPVGETGQSFLMGRDGLLIASSEYDVIDFDEKTNEYERFSLENIPAPLLNTLAEALAAQQIELSELESATKITIHYQGDTYFVSLAPLEGVHGLDWLSVVILPEADFVDVILEQDGIVIAIFTLLALSLIAFSVLSDRWLLRPLLLLDKKIQRFDFKHPEELYSNTRLAEISQISESFNNLVHRLNNALFDLQKEIDEHKQSKNRLLWSETLYRSVVEDSPGLLCSFLPTGEITFANKSYAEYYGTSPNELVGKSFIAFLHEDDREGALRNIHELNTEFPTNSVSQRVRLPSGEVRHQRWVNRALFTPGGEVIGYQSFGEDVEKEFQIQQMQSALYRIAQAANRVPTLDELYAAIHEIVQEIFPAENFYIALLDQERETLLSVYNVDEMDATQPLRKTKTGPSAYVINHKTSLRCTPEEFFALMPDIDPSSMQDTPPKIWLGVPLLLEGKALGIMAVQNYKDEHAFGAYEQEFLEMISTSVAATIARQRAEEETRTYAQTNALLFQASQAISEALDINHLYQTLYHIIAEIMDCDFLMVSAYNPEEKSISCAYLIQSGQPQDVSNYPALPLNPDGEGTQSKAIISKKPSLISDYLAQLKTSRTTYPINDEGNLGCASEEIADENITRSAIIIPLLFNREVSGVIQVMSYRKAAYTNENLRIVEALSNQIAIASNNARLYQQAQTELYRRQQAEEELQKLNAELEERVKKRTIELHERISTVERLNAGMANILHDLNIANDLAEKNAHKLREANAELETFSYSVSHDLRAPLRHVESFTQILHKRLENRLSEEEERYFANIFSANTKMRNLINDLLALSRTSTVDFNLKRLDFNQMVESVRAELFDELEGRNIRWTLATLPTIQADAGLIKVVWTNLISNAVKYTRLCKTATIEIGSLPASAADFVEPQQIFFVRDNGVGFDEAYSDKLFGVFQRLHQSEEFEGNGIGLATVHRIVARHGGRVWAESVVNHGATFYFSLPIRTKSDTK